MLSVGQKINNRYRIAKLLGQGGFGAVYRAWDLNMEGLCAIKESFEHSPEAERQFKREASLLFNLKHQSLPKVYDFFSLPGQGLYLVMEFIQGEDLQSRLDRTAAPLPENQALAWIAQICDALAYLHSQTPAIIHRDIKPANLRITPQGNAVLVDFGIAKAYDPSQKTTIGARAITPGYSPIEQYGGSGRTDARTDVYALGATLYTLLTKVVPPEPPERNIGAPLIPVRQINTVISSRTEAAVLQALALHPDQRFTSANAFKNALQEPLLVQQTEKAPSFSVSSAAISAPAIKKRFPSAWLGAAGAAVIILLAIVAIIAARNGIQSVNPTAPVVAMLPSKTSTPTSLPSATLSPSPQPTSTAIPSTQVIELPLTPTETLSPASEIIYITDWELENVEETDKDCFEDTVSCWRCATNSCSMKSSQGFYINPDWENPSLLYLQIYIPTQMSAPFDSWGPWENVTQLGVDVFFDFNGKWTQVNEHVSVRRWVRETIALKKYHNQEIKIQFRYHASYTFQNNWQWVIQDIRIDPNYQPNQ